MDNLSIDEKEVRTRNGTRTFAITFGIVIVLVVLTVVVVVLMAPSSDTLYSNIVSTL